MKFINYEKLPENVKLLINKGDYVGYLRVYYRYGCSSSEYGSRFFYKDAANGTIPEINRAEERGKKRYTQKLHKALQSVAQALFKKDRGRYGFYAFCEEKGFDVTADGYMGYCYLKNAAFQIAVSKSEEYFCRIYLYDRQEEMVTEN